MKITDSSPSFTENKKEEDEELLFDTSINLSFPTEDDPIPLTKVGSVIFCHYRSTIVPVHTLS